MKSLFRTAIVLLSLLALIGGKPAVAEVRGEYGMKVRVNLRNVDLTYRLRLNRRSDGGDRQGDAEMTVSRNGFLPSSNRTGDDYGSIATVYLRNRDRVVHRGTWTMYDDRITVTLNDIDGRRDRAVFTGTADDGDRILNLRTDNTGMYGNNVTFRLDRDFRDRQNGNNSNDNTPEEFQGTYQTTHQRRIDGRWVRLEYRLRLRDGGNAEMEISTRDNPDDDRDTGRAFGSIATVYLRDRRRVRHTGRWTASGDNVTVTLEEIEGRRDRTTFTGSLRRDRLNLSCNNRGMYGEMIFLMDRR
ncbi:MAG: hypothetical protein SFU56_08860 [Capsulimonadales bacterium]|nr:hypothetical protein [Capsulimonadales bacterium]